MNALSPLELRSALPIETRADGDDPITAMTGAVDELRSGFETFRTSTEQRLTTELRGLTDRLAAVETRMNRPTGQRQENRADPEAELERRAFEAFARRGIERMAADEVRALTVSTDTAGGFLAPEQFVRELDRNLVLFSPIRSIARVTPAGAGEILLPKRTGTMTASWGGETTPATATQPAYDQQKITVHELKCFVDVSNTLLEDAAFDLASELAYDFSEEFGKAEGSAFIAGDGTNKPTGLLSNADIAKVTSANATQLIGDDILDVFHALPSAYAARGSWAMNRATIATVRKIKNVSGDYLWTPSLQDGNPGLLLGRPVVEMPDMPDLAPGATPVVFGDFAAGFRIFDRVALSVLRDPYSQQVNGLVRFHARRRVGGGVTKAEAFKFLKIKAA